MARPDRRNPAGSRVTGSARSEGLTGASDPSDSAESRPVPGSTYPLQLLPTGADAGSVAVRALGLVAAAVAVGVFFVVTPMVNLAVQSLGWVVSGRPGSLPDHAAAGTRFEHVWGLLSQHLALGVLVPVLLGLMRFLHRRSPAWLWSVSPGVRWRYALACWLLSLPVYAAGLLVGGLAPLHPQPQAAVWLVAIVLTSPLQAVAEEVLFRGYLMQAFGMVVRQAWFPIVATAVLFALFHGVQNPWLFGSRLAFGLLAGVLVWRTGGLEAPAAAHVTNNLLAFGAAVLTSSVAEVRAVQVIGWAESLRDLLMYGAFTALAVLVAVRMRVPWQVAGHSGAPPKPGPV